MAPTARVGFLTFLGGMGLAALGLVFLGGALGAIGRFVIGRWIGMMTAATLPVGTLVINLTGSFLLGVWSRLQPGLGSDGMLLLATGLTGAFTTFSTFSYETVRLLEERLSIEALLNLLISLALGLLAVIVGHWAGGVVG